MDFTKICRLCCEKKFRMHSIFEENQKFPMKHLFEDVLQLQVYPRDGLPQQVCKLCVASLMKINETIEGFRANDLMLRKQLVGVEIKEEEEEMEVEALDESFAQELEFVEPNEPTEVLDAVEQEVKEEQENTLGSESEFNDVADKDVQLHSDELDQNDPKPKKRSKAKLPRPEAKKARRSKPEYEQANILRRRRRKDPNSPRYRDTKCYICKSDSWGSAEALVAHLSSHSNELPYVCTVCVAETVTINNVSTLNIHKRMHENPLKCPQCDRRYSNKHAVQLHIQGYHENTACPSTCDYCGRTFPTKQSLQYHLKIHTEGVACEFCGKLFIQKHKLRLHIQRKHEKMKTHECHICQKKLSGLDAVQVHIRIMHSNQEFECQYCSRKYTSELTLRYHEKKHETNPNYKTSNDWKQYYTFVEGEEGIKDGVRLKKCSLCGIIAKGIGAHLSAVHFPTEYRCDHCGLTFKRKVSYDIHVLEHERGKAHQCPICGREFSERKNLIVHLKTKKHRDHPLAKSLDWLYGKSDYSVLKRENTNEDTEKIAEEHLVNEIEVGLDIM